MTPRTRRPLVLALTMSAIGLCFAGIAWACTPNPYGKPSAPAAAASPASVDPATAQASEPASATATATATSAVSPATAPASGESAVVASPAAVGGPSTAVSGTTRGAALHRATSGPRSASARGPRPAAARPVVAGGGPGVTLAVRNAGAAAGAARVSERPVVRRPAAPARAKAPSARPAHSGPWGPSASAAKPAPIEAASSQSAAGRGGGLGPSVIAGLLLLGVGLTGAFGAALALTVTRRRARAPVQRNGER